MTDEIRKPDPDKGEGNAVQSVTEVVPHPADADSSPGPYEGLHPDRPPVSSSQAPAELAHSLVAGAGAPSPDSVTPPEDEAETEETKKVGRPRKADS
jgi:hypothetical protein